MRFRAALVVAVLMALPAAAAARQRPVVRTEPTPPPDVFSAAELADVRTRHLALDLEIDFDARRLRGSATHAILNLTGTDRLVLDTRDLEIIAVTVDGRPATWSLGMRSRSGRALRIPIAPSTRSVRIDYETRGDAGLQFFDPLQTDGDLAPFFFTFGQPDRTREWIPVQDTPGARMTFEATIRVPPGLVALMSARNATTPSPDGVYRFEMPLPTPPYLIALAAGRVAFHPLSARTGIWAEPERLADAAHDLSYIPAMLLVAEEMIGAYPYERYDVVLLPAGFSAGGMENPMLNFINVASVVRGNGETPPVPHRLIAHELAHSWAGDTVTCATWGDLWLNEGFASYYTNRILEAMRGAEHGDHGFYLDRSSFEEYAASTTDDALEILHRELGSGDDRALFTPTVYSKGSIFLKMLEDRMGRPAFDAFARSWFLRYAYRWADLDAFRDHLEPFVAPGVSLQLDAWLHEPGLPSNVTAPDRSIVIDRIAAQANAFRGGTPARSLDTASWTSYEHGIFLSLLGTDLGPRLAELDTAFGYSAGAWPPAVAWVVAVAETLYGPGLPLVERFLRSGTWNVIAVYGWLAENPLRREWAIATYERMRPHYVEGIRILVDEILGLEASGLKDAA